MPRFRQKRQLREHKQESRMEIARSEQVFLYESKNVEKAPTLMRRTLHEQLPLVPAAVLARKVPSHAGTQLSISAALGEAIAQQHREHPRWSYKLHHDNIVALAREEPELEGVPGYATVCRYMKGYGLFRAKRKRHAREPGFVSREARSFEVSHVHGLWHLDSHQGSRALLTVDGEWHKPQLLGIIDDRSRLCCHLQWY
jgi:hypothetical protein